MIRLEKVSKKYDQFELKNIDLDILDGEYLVILGPSGAGKTVILELIAGVEKLSSGKIYGTENKKLGFIYQDYMLFPHLNVFKNIAYGLRFLKLDKSLIFEKVDEIANRLNISHLLERDIATLSGGEQQRVAIARALIIKPDIVFLDEPTAALDNNKRKELQKLFIKLHKETGAVFLHVTHDFEEALAVADRIAVLENGSVVQLDKPENIFNKPADVFVADFIGYSNVFKGSIKDHFFISENIKIYVNKENCEESYIAIKSSDIIVSKKHFESSARNSFEGKIVEIRSKLEKVEIVVDIGIVLNADISYRSLEEMNLKCGDNVFCTFKTSSILIFEH
ncbi:MAG: ATP-binding cassette domain-containing protein [Candidatus Delongbacteria bacterium]|nr:ATP-binding cassette domain-containing protein [Candidatus Delongbacteria bacterium]MBN2835475.1 ATP-binding cassette domain-containing protein [Candidatus Delongbacteria bacterium]